MVTNVQTVHTILLALLMVPLATLTAHGTHLKPQLVQQPVPVEETAVVQDVHHMKQAQFPRLDTKSPWIISLSKKQHVHQLVNMVTSVLNVRTIQQVQLMVLSATIGPIGLLQAKAHAPIQVPNIELAHVVQAEKLNKS
jgi:hypothetical protein